MNMNRDAFAILREPLDSLLHRHGVESKPSHKGSTTWFNLKDCPICNKTGFQCGLSESTGIDGKLVHGVKCQHVGGKVAYEDFLYAIGALSTSDVDQIRCFKAGIKPTFDKNVPSARVYNIHHQSSRKVIEDPSDDTPWNKEYGRRLQKGLRDNPDAMDYLLNRGLSRQTIDRFCLGLSKPYIDKKSGFTRKDALVFPIFSSEGIPINKNAYYNIPGVTENPIDPNGWMAGRAHTYYGDADKGQRILFVCEGMKDLWKHWQAIAGTYLSDSILLITSTHGTNFPDEWANHEFWDKWDTVYFGQDNDIAGETLAIKLSEIIGRESLRVRVPSNYGKDWNDFWQNGGSIEEFEKILRNAPLTSRRLIDTDENDLSKLGRFPYTPIDANQAFHNGHLYYPVQTIFRDEGQTVDPHSDETIMETFERIEVVVIRSDGVTLRTIKSKAHKGTPENQRVLRLSDGTLINRMPKSNPRGTWSWASIERYTKAKENGLSVKVNPINDTAREIIDHLKHHIWLPNYEDYVLLAIIAIVTYVQSIFDAVPLIMVNGEKGSGKSDLGHAMCDVCANSNLVGVTSAATIARSIDETRGFIVLDDCEAIGSKDSQFSDLAQALKLSYKKATATKLWTDVKTMKVEELNFFGIKMLNNTSGVDKILGSRMLHISTRKRSPGEWEEYSKNRSAKSNNLSELRDNLHTWAFENVTLISATYQNMFPQLSDRSEEIAAPLRTIAQIIGDPELTASLEKALARQATNEAINDEPEDILKEALKNLVLQGFKEVAVAHVVMEMQTLVPENYFKTTTTEIPVWEQPEWVSKKAKYYGYVERENTRRRLWSKNLRFLTITPNFIDAVQAEVGNVDIEFRDPVSFCAGCKTCPYKTTKCVIMGNRISAERSMKPWDRK